MLKVRQTLICEIAANGKPRHFALYFAETSDSGFWSRLSDKVLLKTEKAKFSRTHTRKEQI